MYSKVYHLTYKWPLKANTLNILNWFKLGLLKKAAPKTSISKKEIFLRWVSMLRHIRYSTLVSRSTCLSLIIPQQQKMLVLKHIPHYGLQHNDAGKKTRWPWILMSHSFSSRQCHGCFFFLNFHFSLCQSSAKMSFTLPNRGGRKHQLAETSF